MTQTYVEKRFDYLAACKEVAAPAVRSLPESVLSIYRDLRDAEEFDGLKQAADLNVPMPESLRARFEALPSDVLAFSARALQSFGHWSGQLDPAKRDTRGATWKYANLADGVLRTRLGLADRGARKGIGWSFEVHEGMLRLCASTPESWTWTEVGPATEDFLALAREWRRTLPGCPSSNYSRHSQSWRDFEEAACKATREAPANLRDKLPEPWRRFLTVCADYMREKGKCSDDCPECGTSRLFTSEVANHTPACSHYPMGPTLDRARAALAVLVKQAETRGIDSGPAKLAAQTLDFYTAK